MLTKIESVAKKYALAYLNLYCNELTDSMIDDLTGLKNFLYKKIRSKEIVSVLLSKRIRLVSVKSIEEFLASYID